MEGAILCWNLIFSSHQYKKYICQKLCLHYVISYEKLFVFYKARFIVYSCFCLLFPPITPQNKNIMQNEEKEQQTHYVSKAKFGNFEGKWWKT